MIALKTLKKYIKKSEYTYSLGAFPTFELLNYHPEYLEMVIISTQVKAEISAKLNRLCDQNNIPLIVNDKVIERIRDKEASIVVGVLRKYQEHLEYNQNHVVLVNPSDMGNLGTIIRTCAGFGIQNLAVIEPAADLFHPKVLRASMGAFFSIHWESFFSFEDYLDCYKENRAFYPFMLKGAVPLSSLERDNSQYYTLIFGNEATGLEDCFLELGQSVLIPYKPVIDSLNLSMAVGIALYEFTKSDFS